MLIRVSKMGNLLGHYVTPLVGEGRDQVGIARFDVVARLVRLAHSNQRLAALSGLKDRQACR